MTHLPSTQPSTNETNRYVLYLRDIACAVVALKEAQGRLRTAQERLAAAEALVDRTPGAREAINALIAVEAAGGAARAEQ